MNTIYYDDLYIEYTTAKSVNFRIGTFTGNIDASEIDGQMAWQVSFTLREHLSVSEKKEIRAVSKVKAKVQTGNPKAPSAPTEEDKIELDAWERVLQKVDRDWIGPA